MTSISDIHTLIVDDNREMRFLLRCLLRAGGVISISEAETAEQAFDVMRGQPVDLLIVDWMMQPVDGLEFTRMVRWRPDSPNPYVPLLMVTAHTEASRVERARDAGVSGFVRKPVSARILYERITSALTDPRAFIRSSDFIGPDRRRGVALDYPGPFRRETDRRRADTIDIDDVRWRA
jgi:CheY-like chemotaxis protein